MARLPTLSPARDRPAAGALAAAGLLLLLVDALLLLFLPRAVLLLAAAAGLAAAVLLAARLPWAVALPAFGLPLLDPLARLLESEAPIFLAVRLVLLLSAGWFALVRLESPGRAAASLLRDPIFLLALLFWGLLAAGSLWTPSPGYARLKLIQYGATHLPLLVAGFLIARRHEGEPEEAARGRFDALLVAILVFAAAIAAVGLLNVRFRFYEYHQRLGVLGINPIWVARTTAVGLVAAVAAARLGRIGPAAGAIAFVPIAAALLLSGSRGPIAGLFLLAAGWLLLRGGLSPARILRAAFAVAAVAAIALAVMPGPLRDRFLDPFAGDVASYVRLGLLRAIREAAAQTPPLGIGTGGFSWLLRMGDIRAYPHNLFAEIWIENGIPGLLCLIGLLAAVARRAVSAARRTGDRRTLLAFGLFLYALWNAQFSGDVTSNEWIWLFAGIVAGRTR